MGYSVPAGIAAKVVAPERTVVSFVGDGGFQMSGLELATAVQHGLDPIVLVINNGLYGTIRMHQERRHPGRVSATELKNPDFAALGRAAGAFGASVARTEDFAPALEQALAAGRAAVLDLQLNPEAISTSTTLSALGAQARP
jgi:acetolactate synthase-1/2/3 large subunit